MARDVAALSLLEALSETGFHASVVATYSCYFPFYEEVVLRRLLDRGCTNNVLLVDARICAKAFDSEDARPRRAGRDYTLIPVRVHGAFHPKLIVAVGRSKGVLFVGSHNMTLAGFGLNGEITSEFRVSSRTQRSGVGVIRAAVDYLRTFTQGELSEVGAVLDAAAGGIAWLDGPSAAESASRTLLTTNGSDEDLWSRIRPLVPDRPSVAFICAPFFDRDLVFLRRLLDDVQPQRLVVGVDPESVEIDVVAARRIPGVEFVNVSGQPALRNRRESGTYWHAKVLWFAGEGRELLVTGSANPSGAAFLGGGPRRNAEAVVVDRRAGAAGALGLDRLMVGRKIGAREWASVARRAGRRDQERDVSGSVVLAVPVERGLGMGRPLGWEGNLGAVAADGTRVGPAVRVAAEQRVIDTSVEIRDRAQTLRGGQKGERSVVVLVHRPDQVARNAGGDRGRDLRMVLGALEEDPSQLGALLKLTEKVIFD